MPLNKRLLAAALATVTAAHFESKAKTMTDTNHTAAQPLDLDSLTRYDGFCSYDGGGPAEMETSKDGEYVKFTEVAALIAQARTARLDTPASAPCNEACEEFGMNEYCTCRAAHTVQAGEAVDEWKVGNLLTMSDSDYPGMGSMFAQVWRGEDLIARVYGDTADEVRTRAALVAHAAPAPVAAQQAAADLSHWRHRALEAERNLEGALRALGAENGPSFMGEPLLPTRAVPSVSVLVDRFLGWPLPKDFSPDCGISFDGRKDDDWNKNKTWPTGTNLFAATQAKAMFEYCLQAAAKAPAAQAVDATDALRKLCDQLDAMRKTRFLMPGTGQNYSYLLWEDASFYVEEARKALAASPASTPDASQQAAAVAAPSEVVNESTIRTIVTKAREFYLGYLSRHIPGDDIDAVRAAVTTDTATRAIAFDLRATQQEGGK